MRSTVAFRRLWLSSGQPAFASLVNKSALQKFLAEMPELPEFFGMSEVGVHTRGGWDSMPLHIAAVRGDVAAIEALLDAGADIHARGEHGFTPLHEAVLQGHIGAVRLLLQRGASVSTTADDEQTPIQTAHVMKEYEIERLLREHAG